MKPHTKHIIAEGYLELDNSHSQLEVLSFKPVKGKCNGIHMFFLPNGYQKKRWRLWIEEAPPSEIPQRKRRKDVSARLEL